MSVYVRAANVCSLSLSGLNWEGSVMQGTLDDGIENLSGSENKVSIRKGDVALIPNSKDFFIATAEVRAHACARVRMHGSCMLEPRATPKPRVTGVANRLRRRPRELYVGAHATPTKMTCNWPISMWSHGGLHLKRMPSVPRKLYAFSNPPVEPNDLFQDSCHVHADIEFEPLQHPEWGNAHAVWAEVSPHMSARLHYHLRHPAFRQYLS